MFQSMKIKIALASLLIVLLPLEVSACSRTGNSPMVESFQWGRYYAKSVPLEVRGSDGKTEIYKVESENDELIDAYNWYSPHGYLSFAIPLNVERNIAVARFDRDAEDKILTFYLAGRELISYSRAELRQIGDRSWLSTCGNGITLRLLETYKPPGTNDVYFQVEFSSGDVKYFDIETGLVSEISF